MDSTSQDPQGSAPPPQPYQSGQQQYPPPAGYAPPPPPQKKGFNWLACCGITCLVLVIIFGGMSYCGYRMLAPIINMGFQLESISQNVKSADAATIKASPISVTPEQLASDATLYKGQWLRLEGELASADTFSSSSFSTGDFSTEDATSYVMSSNILVMDVTGAPAVAGAGDTIVAYGQYYGWDLLELEKIPFVGKIIVDEMKNDPNLGGNTQMIFFLAKEVERVGVAGIDSSAETVDFEVEPEDDSGSGWLR
jgi:hypothetical protein